MGLESQLEKVFGAKIFYDEPMKKHTSFKLGGNCRYFIKAEYLITVKRVVELLIENNIPYKILGNGTNLLISDKGFNGAIIKPLFADVIVENNTVLASSSVNLSTLSKVCLSHELTGLEALGTIPATVGGAICMNASAFSESISDNLIEVSALIDGKLKYLSREDCGFSYRDSIFRNSNYFIVNAKFIFDYAKKEDIKEKSNYLSSIRASLQPKGNTCGSVFRNTKKYSAGELIENCGLKGFSIGGATISDKHANFIIASLNCTSNNVYDLIRCVKRKVYEKYKILLTEEVEYIGEFE